MAKKGRKETKSSQRGHRDEEMKMGERILVDKDEAGGMKRGKMLEKGVVVDGSRP